MIGRLTRPTRPVVCFPTGQEVELNSNTFRPRELLRRRLKTQFLGLDKKISVRLLSLRSAQPQFVPKGQTKREHQFEHKPDSRGREHSNAWKSRLLRRNLNARSRA